MTLFLADMKWQIEYFAANKTNNIGEVVEEG